MPSKKTHHRSRWVSERSVLLTELLHQRHGLRINDDGAQAHIWKVLQLIAEARRVPRLLARRHITRAVLTELADRIAAGSGGDNIVDLTVYRSRRTHTAEALS